jgi:hypothetical protein
MEPAVRALMVEFAEELEWTFVMGGLAREFQAQKHVHGWLDAAAESGMPTDPRGLFEAPLTSTYPACMAVKAAQEQGTEAGERYLRRVREGILALRRKLDTTEGLVEEARAAGLDVERFRIDLGSHAIVEAFGLDLEESRDVPDVVREVGKVRCSRPAEEERVPFPTFRFEGNELRWTCGFRPYEALREAAAGAGAEPSTGPRPDAMTAISRFGRMARAEIAAVCDLPGPRADAELARLALEWRVRPVPVVSDRLWEAATGSGSAW